MWQETLNILLIKKQVQQSCEIIMTYTVVVVVLIMYVGHTFSFFIHSKRRNLLFLLLFLSNLQIIFSSKELRAMIMVLPFSLCLSSQKPHKVRPREPKANFSPYQRAPPPSPWLWKVSHRTRGGGRCAETSTPHFAWVLGVESQPVTDSLASLTL